VICDCRALPGQTVADVEEHVAAALGSDLDYELELLEGGTASPLETPLYRVCREWVAERLPGAGLLPLISTGFTDSHWVRSANDTVAYGFAPVLETDPQAYFAGAHGADETLAVGDLVETAEFNLHAARALPAAATAARS
jgi:acetylornithine deacetylase/succinyl-diaminopimelate desuccinylase-like protein